MDGSNTSHAEQGGCALTRRPSASAGGRAGFALIEVLVAALVLIVGMLATFAAVSAGNASLSKTRAREAATNLVREVLEDSFRVLPKNTP